SGEPEPTRVLQPLPKVLQARLQAALGNAQVTGELPANKNQNGKREHELQDRPPLAQPPLHRPCIVHKPPRSVCLASERLHVAASSVSLTRGLHTFYLWRSPMLRKSLALAVLTLAGAGFYMGGINCGRTADAEGKDGLGQRAPYAHVVIFHL